MKAKLFKPGLFAIGLLLSLQMAYAQCDCDFTIPAGSGTFTFDGAARGAQPGDVICLAAGVRERIVFTNLEGSPTDYITIKNCGGQALIGGPNANNGIGVSRSRYFRITGTGDPGYFYGIKITETRTGSQGIAAGGFNSHMEFDHLEITKVGFAGIMAKVDPSNDCNDKSGERPTWGMININIHDNYIHDIGGEGLYIGNSFYNGTQVYCGSTQYAHEVYGVKIYNNLFKSCGWESIQVGSTVGDCEIYNNIIYDYGVGDVASQNGGVQLGVGTAAKFYNNFIKKGTGVALYVLGPGRDYLYNNIIDQAGDAAIGVNVRPVPSATPVSYFADLLDQAALDAIAAGTFQGPVRIINNTILNPELSTIAEIISGTPNNFIANNFIVGGSSAWNKLKTNPGWGPGTMGNQGKNLYVSNLVAAKFEKTVANGTVTDLYPDIAVDIVNYYDKVDTIRNRIKRYYKLDVSSPAKDQGLNIESAYNFADLDFENDYANNLRDTQWDIGALEIGSGNQLPIISVGANQTLVLPTNSTTVTGSATDADGSIVSYLWTKQSGPAATLTNQSTSTLSLTDLTAGVYVFRLTVTDDGGATAYRDLTITVVDPSVNQPPVANAGGSKTITLPTNTTVLNGIGSDPDGTVITYAWTKISVPDATLSNETTPNLTVTNLLEGTYVFRLTVTDEDGDETSDDATVTVNPAAANQPPTANAGPDRNLVLPTNSVNLNGSGSDPDGSIASYLWTKQSGPTATLNNANTATLQLTNLAQGNYVFRLTVTDNNGSTAFDAVNVTVSAANQAPTANAGGNKTIQLPTNATTLTGSGSDPDGNITAYAWTKVSGPAATINNANTAVLTLTNLVEGVYVFRLTVTDNTGATGSNSATVTVQAANVPPQANAGANQTLILPTNSTTLNGSGIDTDGAITVYLWEKVSGPTATLTGASTPTLNLTNLVEGSYTFRLTVTDNGGATGSSLVTITVVPATINQSPAVNAGPDITLTLPANAVDITGTATDPDGTISSYLWEKISGPDATISGTTTATLSLADLVVGVYVFRLTATDNGGASASNDIRVSVTNANQAPVVNAGSNQVITLPTSSAILQAIASDPDGSIQGYLWILTSGPNAPTLSGTITNTLSVSGLEAGTYIFRVTVTDNLGATAFSQVNVTVQTATNISPLANAGPDITLFLPTNSTNLNGSGSDADGSIASYLWTQVSGVAATLSNANSSTLSLSNLVEGVYIFRLAVTDNASASGIDDVTVTVLPASANQPPVVNAGPDIALTLPINSTNLIGSGSDAGGTITSYTWNKLSGPSATLSNQNTAVLSLQDLVEGVYIFRLTITDNDGVSASDNAQVTVFPSSVNQPPTVTAGNNKTITLPTSTTTLVATASDPDGSIAAYMWAKQIGPPATISGENSSTLTITALVEGVYTFRVTVEDNQGATSFAEVSITVQAIGTNQPPVVNAGIDKILFLPTNTVNLTGSASDANGTITAYEWTKTNGPSVTLSNANTPNLSLSNLMPGQYIFRLTATDNLGATGFAEASVTVFPGTINQPPIAYAGVNQTLVLPNNSTTLNGSGFDPDGSIAAYSWTQLSGQSTTLTNINSPSLFVDGLMEGTYQFQLTVQDDQGATGSSSSQIVVVAEGANLPPSANAGFDQVINLPQNSLDIQGSGTDLDGTITAYVWLKKSGPATVTIANQNTSRLSLSNLIAGTYVFTLTVTDNQGLTNSDDVRVTVVQAATNKNPVVNAGTDMVVRLPTTTAVLTATATDEDGSISAHLWSQQSGPAVTMAGQTTAVLSLSNLELGTYIFSVEVTDNTGATATDEVVIRVIDAAVNQPPIVLTGSPKVIALPVTSTSIAGSASDQDGIIQNILWTVQTGPNAPQLSGESTTTLNLQNLVAGTYALRLTATDNEGATSFAETTLQVKPSHQLPVVFAGNDTTLVLPDNHLLWTGEVIPGDGAIVDYLWEQIEGEPATIEGEFPEIALVNLMPDSYTFRLTVTDDIDMQVSDDINIVVIEGKSNPIGASILLTPNADGINDIWLVKNLTMVEGCPVRIFNSLGKAVYTSDQYQNDWSGEISDTGQSLRDGDYYFIFDCGGKKRYSGAFRLMR